MILAPWQETGRREGMGDACYKQKLRGSQGKTQNPLPKKDPPKPSTEKEREREREETARGGKEGMADLGRGGGLRSARRRWAPRRSTTAPTPHPPTPPQAERKKDTRKRERQRERERERERERNFLDIFEFHINS